MAGITQCESCDSGILRLHLCLSLHALHLCTSVKAAAAMLAYMQLGSLSHCKKGFQEHTSTSGEVLFEAPMHGGSTCVQAIVHGSKHLDSGAGWTIVAAMLHFAAAGDIDGMAVPLKAFMCTV